MALLRSASDSVVRHQRYRQIYAVSTEPTAFFVCKTALNTEQLPTNSYKLFSAALHLY